MGRWEWCPAPEHLATGEQTNEQSRLFTDQRGARKRGRYPVAVAGAMLGKQDKFGQSWRKPDLLLPQ